MNKRIKLLAEQAGMYVDLKGNPWPKSMSAEECEAAYKKFAELIVKECTKEIMYSSVGQEDPVFAYEYVKHLKTTFSIAE